MPNKFIAQSIKFQVHCSKSKAHKYLGFGRWNTELFFSAFRTIRLCGVFASSLAFFSFFLLPGCKEPEISNLEVLPDNDKLGVLSTDTATVIPFTLPDDSIRSDETSLNLMGVYNDPVFGVAKAAIFTQIRMSSENNEYFGNPFDLVVDSVILSLVYSGNYGNLAPQSFKVFELAENMNIDSNYYSTKVFLYKTPEIGNAVNIVPNLSDSVLAGEQKEPPQLRISLNKSFGDQLIKADLTTYQSNENFLNFFKGLAILPDTGVLPAVNDGAILFFNLLHPYSKLTVYYQNVAEADTFKFDFLINDKCAITTSFNFNRSGTSIFASDSVNGNDLFYIQSMSGAKSKIIMPFLENFVEKGKVAVNKAEIIFNVGDNSTVTFSPHLSLFLTNIDSSGKAGFLLDQFEGADHYGGSYNSSTKQYVFNITRHIQFLLSNYYEGKNYNYGMFLMAGGKAVNANRTILKGNTNSGGGVKLKISYTAL